MCRMFMDATFFGGSNDTIGDRGRLQRPEIALQKEQTSVDIKVYRRWKNITDLSPSTFSFHRWQICRRCCWYWWQIVTGVVDTGSNLPPVSTPPVSMTPAANFATSFPSVVDTGGKFAAGVIDTGGKLPPVLLTPVANFPPVANLDLQISPRIFWNIWNGPNGILRGWGETDSWKKPVTKNLVTLSP